MKYAEKEKYLMCVDRGNKPGASSTKPSHISLSLSIARTRSHKLNHTITHVYGEHRNVN